MAPTMTHVCDSCGAELTNALYGPASNLTAMADVTEDNGGGQAHNNMQPYLTINFIIALQGLFPSRS